jgi:hypothetical protein
MSGYAGIGDHISAGLLPSVSDQIQTLQNCLSTPIQKLGTGWVLK